jgi:hypothetical protein
MNDFTKKELIALEDAMQHMFALHRPQDGKSPLLDKLQTMIDNYCDHEGTLIANSEVNYILSCSKCATFKGWV